MRSENMPFGLSGSMVETVVTIIVGLASALGGLVLVFSKANWFNKRAIEFSRDAM